MQVILETMKRKKAAMNLDSRQVTMLENAYYMVRWFLSLWSIAFSHPSLSPLQCNPPDRPAVPQKERTPMQLYMRYLFYNALTRNTSDKVLKLVRKLHWEDPAVSVIFPLLNADEGAFFPTPKNKLTRLGCSIPDCFETPQCLHQSLEDQIQQRSFVCSASI